MHLLIRDISPYTGPDLLLGAFATAAAAEQAREEYMSEIAGRDPWAEQAYRSVDPARDVRVQPIEHRGEGDDDTIHVLVEYREAMGQIVAGFLTAFADPSAADAAKTALEENEHSWANYADIETLTLGDRRWRHPGFDRPPA
ncbi:hypothetical protein J5226_13130 [Lysobacter sp. K5869]|uniref:hypothetical protein n=1 Tax=Lysobacter sp. K5869 TaxID=2820808 RepID=UPI001C062E36|nr:hypothetical protein [Lysobacter sp. K5869]QWP74636.1 hypothetical protein J5226_13130 [Lysobacter sp. K5869]